MIEFINLKEANESKKKNIPELNKMLNEFGNKLRQFGVDSYIIVVSDKRHPLGGGSATHNPTHNPNDPVTLLEQKFIEWEKSNGISRKHDWNKDGWDNL